MDWDSISDALRHCDIALQQSTAPRPVGGGDISAAWQIQTARGPLFLKTGPGKSFEMFEAEAEGLREIASAKAIRVPEVLAVARYEGGALLALEWLHLERASTEVRRIFGRQLAALHRCTHSRYGWRRDNTIGATPQRNQLSGSWVDFFRERRLGYQLELAASNGYGADLRVKGDKLLNHLDVFFEDYTPEASLLHGDLWGGNWSSCGNQPVIYDPAVYYGDRETDIAMTRLFGGFGSDFYAAYAESWPMQEGHERRVPLYQLYHVLNHLNLFGGGYLAQSLSMMNELMRPLARDKGV